MTSLEGICAPHPSRLGRACWSDLLAPRGTVIGSGLGPAKGPACGLLFDLLSSCSGLLKHAAATTPATAIDPASLTVTGTRLLGPAALALVMNQRAHSAQGYRGQSGTVARRPQQRERSGTYVTRHGDAGGLSEGSRRY
jgi:hypothetical protein